MAHNHNHDHEQQDHEVITLVDEQGNETLFEILLTIDGREEFGKNFDNITVKVTGIKWQSDTIELTANVDGKNFLFPMVLNIRDINPEKDHVDQTDYFNEVKADLNSFKPANINVKLTYKLENGKWALDDKNFLKLLNALVFVKYYNKSIEESL